MAWLERSFPPEEGNNFRLYVKVLTWDEDPDVQYQLSIRTFPKGYSRVEVERWDYEESYWRPTNDWPKNLLPLLIRLAQEAEPESVAFESPIFGEGSVLADSHPGGYETIGEWLRRRIERAFEEGAITGSYLNIDRSHWVALGDADWMPASYRLASLYPGRRPPQLGANERAFCEEVLEWPVSRELLVEALVEFFQEQRSLLLSHLRTVVE